MIRSIVGALMLLFSLHAVGQDSLQFYFNQARINYKAKAYDDFYKNIKKANRIHPYHQGVLYQAGIASALVGKKEESIWFLKKAINVKANFDLETPDLAALSEETNFINLRKEQQNLLKPEIHSDTAFTLADRKLHVESIASGNKKNVFYLSSIHKRKILQVDDKGNVRDFAGSSDGLAAVFGLKVDSKRNFLWVSSSPVAEMDPYDTTTKSAVYKYDLKTKKLLSKFYPNHSAKEFVLGDLILDASGVPYVSDSKNNIIFTVNDKTNKLEPFFSSSEFLNIQGIAMSSDGQYLFVADYIKGIYRLTTKTKELILLSTDFDISLKSTDGLIFHDNSLIAIQNQVVPMRALRVFLNDKSDKLVRYVVIDNNHPGFGEPTNGCIVNNHLFYVANSQWGAYDKGKIKVESLHDILILKYQLQ
jgi:sugar lactone lactonase YvrE